MGLSRQNAKKLANVFLIVGLFLALPPFVPDPTDIFSLWLANRIVEKFAIPLMAALALTYVSGILLIILGAWIYPYNTHSLLNGYVNKLKVFLKRESKNPRSVIIGIFGLGLLYLWYLKQVGG